MFDRRDLYRIRSLFRIKYRCINYGIEPGTAAGSISGRAD